MEVEQANLYTGAGFWHVNLRAEEALPPMKSPRFHMVPPVNAYFQGVSMDGYSERGNQGSWTLAVHPRIDGPATTVIGLSAVRITSIGRNGDSEGGTEMTAAKLAEITLCLAGVITHLSGDVPEGLTLGMEATLRAFPAIEIERLSQPLGVS